MTFHVPERLSTGVRRSFGQDGATWLTGLDRHIDLCVQRWALRDLSVIPRKSDVSLLLGAESGEYGSAVLRLTVPGPPLAAEAEALRLYRGRGVCRLFDSDLETGALLLERIVPGGDLTGLSYPERLDVAGELVSRLPAPIRRDHGLPSYRDWLTGALSGARRRIPTCKSMNSLMDEAERVFSEIDRRGHPHVLLHGDLHHKNILWSEITGWTAIDPKGATGSRCLEAGRFMLNEIEMTPPLRALDDMTEVFSRALGESRWTVAACGFVDSVVSGCWLVDDKACPCDVGAVFDRSLLYLDHLSRVAGR